MDSQLIYILACVLLSFIVIFKNVGKRSRLPPGPWKLPIIGNLHQIEREAPMMCLRDLAKKHGPIMHIKLGEVSTVIISSPKLAEVVMKTNDINFVDRPALPVVKEITNNYHDLSFAPYGPYWKQMRKISSYRLLNAKKVQSFQTVREEETSNFVTKISQSISSEAINFSKEILTLTDDVFSRSAFGKVCKDNQDFIPTMRIIVGLAGGFDLGDLFPSIKFFNTISGRDSKIKKMKAHLFRILRKLVEEHLKNKKQNEDEQDLLDVLLEFQLSNDLEVPVTIDDVIAVTLDLFTGGNDTTATALEWTMSELMRHPREMEKLQTEIRRVFHNSPVNEERIHELRYLKAVVKESLRLHPPIPLCLPRICRETCEIDGYVIPAKTQVMVNAWAIARDPEYWEDAEMFKPERFISNDKDYKGTQPEYLPFGAGRRMCPGLLFGIANVDLILAKILYHFDWSLPNGVKPNELDMTEIAGVTSVRKNALYLVPTLYTK